MTVLKKRTTLGQPARIELCYSLSFSNKSLRFCFLFCLILVFVSPIYQWALTFFGFSVVLTLDLTWFKNTAFSATLASLLLSYSTRLGVVLALVSAIFNQNQMQKSFKRLHSTVCLFQLKKKIPQVQINRFT